MAFTIRYHGGACCGIKHIASLEGYNPTTQMSTFTEGDRKYYGTDTGFIHLTPGSYLPSGSDFPELPKEVAALRLFRLIDILTNAMAAHRIEITLIQRQKPVWEQILFNIGFKEIGQHKNSNSGNIVTTYWLVYDQNVPELKLPRLLETLGVEYGYEKKAVKKKPVKKAPFSVPVLSIDEVF